jgi:hypothetical protein
MKVGDWVVGKKYGSVGIITDERIDARSPIYRVKYLDSRGQWQERYTKEGLEGRVEVITKEVADILIAVQLNERENQNGNV